MHTNSKNLRTTFDVASPSRGDIPSLARDALSKDYLQAAAVDATLAFCMVAALKGEAKTIAALETQLARHFGSEFPGSALYKYWHGNSTSLGQLDEVCANVIGFLRTGQHIEPKMLWEMGLRLFEKIGQSSFKVSTTPVVARWLREQWTRVIAQERFRLSQPNVTVPAIESALANEKDDGPFVAVLLLATEDAVEASLATAYRDQLRSAARDSTMVPEAD